MNIALGGLRGRLVILCAALAGSLLAAAPSDAATVSRPGNTLTINEDGGASNVVESNRITVGYAGTEFVVTDVVNLQPVAPCYSTSNPLNPQAPSRTVRCPDPAESITSFNVTLGDSADILLLNSAEIPARVTSSTVSGGPGADTVQGLIKGNDTVNGGDDSDELYGNGNTATGSDELRGDAGTDTLYGGDGNDTLEGGTGDDDFNGGNGIDTANYDDDNSTGVGVKIEDGGQSGPGCYGTSGSCEGDVIRIDVENVTGTDGPDYLEGSDRPNQLSGLQGNDTLKGLGDADTLLGAQGNDRLQGGFGNDSIQGGDGIEDVVDYKDRTDPADPRSDVVVDLSAGTGTAPGGKDAQGNNLPQESDSISGTEWAETGAGDDVLIGTDTRNEPNLLHGGAGNDLLRGKDGPDQLFGGADTDTVSYEDDADDNSNVTVTLADGQANDGSNDDLPPQNDPFPPTSPKDNVASDVENVIGGPDHDTLRGSGANNRIEGGGGDDTMIGLGGSDIFFGGLVTPPTGFVDGTGDTVSYSDRTATQGIVADLDGDADDGDPTANNGAGEDDQIDASVENLTGGDGHDQLTGNASRNVLSGLGGDDLLRGGLGGDVLSGGGGEDTVDYSSDSRATGVTVTIGNQTADDGTPPVGGPTPQAGEGDDVQGDVEHLVGTAANDNLTGSASAGNILLGLAGADQLAGLGGDDTLDGGESAGDALNGGGGNDLLHGGSNGTNLDGGDFIDGGTGIGDTITYARAVNEGATPSAARTLLVDLASEERTGDVRVAFDGIANEGDIIGNESDSAGLVENAIGGQGNDILIGHTGAAGVASNTLDGRAGDDTLDGGAEGTIPVSDTLIGGPGTRDHANYSSRGDEDDLTITLEEGEPNDGETDEKDDLVEVEDVTTAAGDDTVTGDPADAAGNRIATGGGTDTITAGVQDSNADSVDCGPGTDEVTADRRDTLTNCEKQNLPDLPVVSVSGPQGTVSEPGTATFTISIDGPDMNNAVKVNYATEPGTATAGQDYTHTTGEAVIAAGSTSTTVNVPVLGDTLHEDNETFRLRISGPTNATLAEEGDVATATIADNDAAPTVSVGSAAPVDEGNSGTKVLEVPVTLSAASSKDITVNYSTSDGTATAGSDYQPVESGTVTIPAGQTTGKAPVTINGDTLDETNETFTVTLSNPKNATLGTSSAPQTINDDDASPTLSIGDASIEEGDSATKDLTFTITLSAASAQTVTVEYDTSDGTATQPADYTMTSGEATIAPGQTSTQVTVPIKGDETPEANETFTVTLTNPENAGLGDDSATGTIVDDDSPRMSVSDPTVAEGDTGTTDATFTVTLSEQSGRAITVDYATAPGSADAEADFTPVTGKLTFQPGDTSKQVAVPVKGDTIDEDDETFTLELSGANGATVEDGTGTGTITDDDDSPALSVAGGEVTEGNDGSRDLVFTVTQSAASERQVTVKYATGDGTAKAGEDYTATTGTLTIEAGATSGEVKVPVSGDTAVEGDEAFTLALSEPSNATLAEGKDKATGTIKNDDEKAPDVVQPAVPGISVSDVKVAEGDTGTAPAIFTVALSVPTTATVTAKFGTSDGTARAGQDYQSAAGTITFAPGERTKTIPVNVIGDRRDEADETFVLTLSEPAGGTLQKASGTALITDDETPRVAPRGVSARTTPSRDRRLPYRFRTTGRVTLPSGVRRSDACAGKVQVRIKAGRKTISTRRATLRRDCTFSRRVSFGIRSRVKPGRLKVQVRFLGNAVLLPKSARTRFVRAG